MANIPESPVWTPDVHQIEVTDAVLGGPDGKINAVTKQLADRTAYLKDASAAAADAAAAADGKADQALQQMAAIEVAAGSAQSNAGLAQQHMEGAQAALALTVQARNEAQAAAGQSSDNARLSGQAAGQATQKASEASASATAAVSAASQAISAKNYIRAAAEAVNESIAASDENARRAEEAANSATGDAGRAETAANQAVSLVGNVSKAVLSYPDYATALAAAATLPDGQKVEADGYEYSVTSGVLSPERPAASVAEVGTIDDLRAIDPPKKKCTIYVRGYYAENDGGGGLFIWDVSSSNPDNGGTVFGSGPNGRWVRALPEKIVRPQMFGFVGDGSPADGASFKAAAEYASAQGFKLQAKSLNIVIKSALPITLTGKADWELADSVFDFQLPSDVLTAMPVALPSGHKHTVNGPVRFNFGGKAHSGIIFLQPTSDLDGTEFHGNGIEVFNTEMQIGAGVASAGLCVRGGFQIVRLRDCVAENIKMRAGAGVIGRSGITGLLVINHYGVAGAYARRTEIFGGSVSDVYSLDPAYQYDMDGIGVFANPADTSQGLSTCDIQGVRFSNCWGRAFKSQAGRTHVEGVRVNMTTQPTGGCVNPLIDFQTGSGSVKDIRVYLSGVNVRSVVAFQGTADSGAVVSTLDFADVTVVSDATLREVVFAVPIYTNIPLATECRNITVRGTVQNVGRIGTSTFDTQSLHIENCIVTQLTQSLVYALSVGGGSAPYRAIVSARNCRNMIGSVPLVWSDNTGQTTTVVANAEGVLLGFLPASGARQDGVVGARGGFRFSAAPDLPEDIRATGVSSMGSRRLIGLYLDAGETYVLPEHGWNCYFARVTMGAFRTTSCQVVVDADGAGAVYTGAHCDVGLTSEPTNGLLKVWGSAGRLTVKNASAVPRVITIELLG